MLRIIRVDNFSHISPRASGQAVDKIQAEEKGPFRTCRNTHSFSDELTPEHNNYTIQYGKLQDKNNILFSAIQAENQKKECAVDSFVWRGVLCDKVEY